MAKRKEKIIGPNVKLVKNSKPMCIYLHFSLLPNEVLKKKSPLNMDDVKVIVIAGPQGSC